MQHGAGSKFYMGGTVGYHTGHTCQKIFGKLARANFSIKTVQLHRVSWQIRIPSSWLQGSGAVRVRVISRSRGFGMILWHLCRGFVLLPWLF